MKSDRALCDEAIGEAREALSIDPDSTIALAAFSLAHFQHLARGTAADRDTAWRESMAAATRSTEVDRAEGFGHVMRGMLLASMPEQTRLDEARECARRGHDLNPHDMRSLMGLAYVETLVGNPERAMELLRQALRVSPRDPMRPNLHQQLTMASFGAKQYANGVAYAQLGIGEAPDLPPLHLYLATNYVGLGEIEKARAAMAEARRIGPEFAQRHLTGAFVGVDRERQWLFARIAAGLEDPATADALR